MLRSKNNAERESIMNQRPVQKEEEKELSTLNDFMKKYPDNITTPLVYFEDGMAPVNSPFTSIAELSSKINENDINFINLLKRKDPKIFESIARSRRESVKFQFNARTMFLSRSLALNLDESISKVIFNRYQVRMLGRMQDIEKTTNRIFKTFIYSGNFINLEDDDIMSYSYNTTVIPSIVSRTYDQYDRTIITLMCDRASVNTKGDFNVESAHLAILKDIAPIFEIFKGQLEWMFYMLRSEAATIYRPMCMIGSNDEEIYNTNIKDDYYKFSL